MDAPPQLRQASSVEREYAQITPALLRWARERAGYSPAEVARKLGVSVERVEQWEAGTARLTMGRLDALADAYKRPTAVFYLAEPPAESEETTPDFREHAGKKALAPELRFQLRRARERRELALDLFAETKQTPPEFTFTCSANESAAVAGERLRQVLGVTLEAQRAWKADASGYRALGAWKDAAERAGVLVFQASRRELGGCRGASIWANPLPVVVLTSDAPAGRAYTLLHEMVHLGLRQGGICDQHDDGVESFCNKVAAAALMPAQALRDDMAHLPKEQRRWPDASIEKLARAYSVSPQALVLRLVELGEVDWSFYRSRRAEFDRRNEAARKSEDSAGFVPQPTLAIARNGRQFTRLVLDAYHRGAITAHSASSYLDVSFKHVPEIERELARHAWKAAS